MKARALNGIALCMSGAVALLAGCGGSQPPIGTPGVMPQTSAITRSRTSVHRMTSSSYRVLYRFLGDKDGANPVGGVIDVKGTLYGTTSSYRPPFEKSFGGAGTVFSLSLSGTKKILHRFTSRATGENPQSGVIDVNGTLYGTTENGGVDNKSDCCGVVYSVTTAGAEALVFSFSGSTGRYPHAGLLDVNGTFYGVTRLGGVVYTDTHATDVGTVYSLSKNGKYKQLHGFFGDPGGRQPMGNLIAVNGTLYGTTLYGGGITHRNRKSNQNGTVYSVTTSGSWTLLHKFGNSPSDGSRPVAGLTNVNGTLYGTTPEGGTYNRGAVYSITTGGTESVLYSFGAKSSDGAYPFAALTDVNGVLYGTTVNGGAHDLGTVFSVTTAGTENVLHSFAGGTDGANPHSGLTRLDVHGTLYGTTLFGGRGCDNDGCGTVFALTP